MAGWGGGRLWLEHLGGSQGGGPPGERSDFRRRLYIPFGAEGV